VLERERERERERDRDREGEGELGDLSKSWSMDVVCSVCSFNNFVCCLQLDVACHIQKKK